MYSGRKAHDEETQNHGIFQPDSKNDVFHFPYEQNRIFQYFIFCAVWIFCFPKLS